MPTELTSKDIRRKKPSETRNVAVDFLDCLDKDASIDETISSISSISAAGLTITSEAVTSVVRKINGRNVPPGKSITFQVAGGTVDTDYEILAVVVTSGGQTIDRTLRMEVRDS